jgi:adenylate cyclase
MIIRSQKAGAEPARAIIQFLAARCRKMQIIINSMRDIVLESDTDESLLGLLKCVMHAVDSRHATLYIIEPATGDIVVRTSSWRQRGSVVKSSQIFGGPSVFMGETVNMYNVKLSDAFTDEHSEIYDKVDPDCILNIPIIAENSKIVGAVEVITKSIPGLPPFFTAEDEFLLKGLGSMWILILNHSEMRERAAQKSDDVRVLLKTVSLMSSELELNSKNNV